MDLNSMQDNPPTKGRIIAINSNGERQGVFVIRDGVFNGQDGVKTTVKDLIVDGFLNWTYLPRFF